MLYSLIGISVLFLSFGFILTEKNAKYLLAGYNSMSEENRKKVDLKNYIVFYRYFHIVLGISFFLVGIILQYFLGELSVSIFMTVYPIVAYTYFIIRSSKYMKFGSLKVNKFTIITLIIISIAVVALLSYGLKDSKLQIAGESIEFTGIYGEILVKSDIKKVELVDKLPELSVKQNGFAMGEVKKGYFKTETGEKVKLIVNSSQKPIIVFIKVDGNKIYFSSEDQSNKEIFNKIQDNFN